MRRRSKKSTAGKQLSSRRVSASTIAPSAPLASSSHMNPNRSWPGVPNKYRMRSRLMVMRPKSSATVVVVLRSTPVRSSTPVPSSVSTSSVRSGTISLTEPTRVVLPTPKPPATSTLTATASSTGPAGRARSSELPNAIEHLLHQGEVGGVHRRRAGPVHHVPPVDQVAGQQLHHAQRQVDLGGA